jgi:hypothetical protein
METLPRRAPLPNFSGFIGEAPYQLYRLASYAIFWALRLCLILTNAAASFLWGSAFAATGPVMIGSLVADREKGLRHQLQMTGLPHRACVQRDVMTVYIFED